MTVLAVDLLAMGYGGSTTYVTRVIGPLLERSLESVLVVRHGAGPEVRRLTPAAARLLEAPKALSGTVGRSLYQRFELPRLMREHGVDVYFVPQAVSSYRRGVSEGSRPRVVAAMRNMLPFSAVEKRRYAWLHQPDTRLRLEVLASAMSSTMRAADRVIFVSTFSRDVVLTKLGAKDHVIIPHGTRSSERSTETAPTPGPAGVLNPRYVAYVSYLEPYKHQDVVVRGFELWCGVRKRNDVQLLLVGRAGGRYGRRVVATVSGSSAPIRWLGEMPQPQVATIMLGAEALLFASTCECCPNVLLEYLASGRPIICSNAPPMPEFGGDAVRYVDPTSVESWAAALDDVVDNPERCEDLARRAAAQAELYSWDRTIDATWNALTTW